MEKGLQCSAVSPNAALTESLGGLLEFPAMSEEAEAGEAGDEERKCSRKGDLRNCDTGDSGKVSVKVVVAADVVVCEVDSPSDGVLRLV